MPDPSQLLRQETIDKLRQALADQPMEAAPTEALVSAVRLAAHEGRERALPPEAIIIQLKILADRVGATGKLVDVSTSRTVSEWMVRMCLQAYWDVSRDQ